MYLDKLVVSLKSNGKFIREDGDLLLLPFGTEYSIYLKNLEDRKALVSISVDGKDVLDGNKLVVRGNSSTVVEGFLKDTICKNKFKFIEKSDRIRSYRGDFPEDGLIRIDWQFEQKPVNYATVYTTISYPHIYRYEWYDPYYNHGTMPDVNSIRWSDTDSAGCGWECSGGGGGSQSSSMPRKIADNQVSCFYNQAMAYSPILDGITVKGTEIDQQWGYADIGNLESEHHIMVLKLRGYNENLEKVEKLTTTREKISCAICGEKNDSKNKYCTECGAYLK